MWIQQFTNGIQGSSKDINTYFRESQSFWSITPSLLGERSEHKYSLG